MRREDYPRVSEILDCLKSFAHIPEAVLRAKANDGTIVHAAIYDWLCNDFPMFLDRNIDWDDEVAVQSDKIRAERRYKYWQSWMKWRDEITPQYALNFCEQRLYDDDLKYSGQIDALCSLGSLQMVLVDYKTSAQVDTVCWPLQAHMYYNLLVKNGIAPLAGRMLFLKLDPKGDLPEVKEYKFNDEEWRYCKLLIEEHHKRMLLSISEM